MFKYAPVQESQSKCDVTDIKKKKELCFVPNCFFLWSAGEALMTIKSYVTILM
jgi:hypothetical protein